MKHYGHQKKTESLRTLILYNEDLAHLMRQKILVYRYLAKCSLNMEWMREKGNHEDQIWPHDQRQSSSSSLIQLILIVSFFPLSLLAGMKSTDDGEC